MDQKLLDDAFSSLTRRQLEDLGKRVVKALVACVICGVEGAEAYRVHKAGRNGNRRFSLMLCAPCVEKSRRAESIAAATT